MIYILVFLFLVLAIFLWQLNSRNQYNIVAISHGILAILLFFMVGLDVAPNEVDEIQSGTLVSLILSGILLLNILLSRFWKIKAAYWPPIFVLITSTAVLCLLQNVFDYNGFLIDTSSISILMLPFAGACIEPIANVKEKILGNFFKIDFKNRRGFSRAAYFLLFGIFLLIAHFIGSYFGVALFALGFGASLFYHKKSSALWNMFLALLAIAAIGHFAKEAKITESSLLLGRVLAGVFFSGFIALFVNTIQRARKNEMLGTVLTWILLLIIPSVIILAVTQNINFGGGDAFIGMLVGFALSAAYGINTRKNDTVLSVYFALGILLIPLTINKQQEKMATISVTDETEEIVEDPFELDGKQIDLKGEYKIDAEQSQLTFELGPVGGRTKGAFKSFEGNFKFGVVNKIFVNLRVESLTTFNGYRDESLMEAAYFNELKFPKMQFESTSFTPNDEGYEVLGKFTMLGKISDIKLQLKYLGKSESSSKEIFIGKSSLNRVDFGMKSDPKEGNVVDFQFKVELDKLKV